MMVNLDIGFYNSVVAKKQLPDNIVESTWWLDVIIQANLSVHACGPLLIDNAITRERFING